MGDGGAAAGAALHCGVPDSRRQLPSVEAVLVALAGLANGDAWPRPLAVEAVRATLDAARASASGSIAPPSVAELAEAARVRLQAEAIPSLRRVINATGVILQTNLGRAPLSEKARLAMAEVADAYSNLEFDLERSERGSRHEHVRDLLRRTTGAEDGIVVNNNAAALLFVLQVFASGREVIISRGQAVEIGGGFRIPDVLRQSGARIVEVGTTNRTYARDYADAMTTETAAILRVHSSNFRIVGFTAEPELAELARVAHDNGTLLLDDLGSGCLVATEAYGIAHEPTVQESLAAGVDLAMFSGDKLLGGPQSGIVVGRGDLLERLRAHPLARALRVDKLTIAALNATLHSYAAGTERDEVPVWRMLAAKGEDLRKRAERWARAADPAGTVVASRSMVGGGSLPGESVPTWCTALQSGGLDGLARALRLGPEAVVGRIDGGALLLDPRTVDPRDDTAVETAIRDACRYGR